MPLSLHRCHSSLSIAIPLGFIPHMTAAPFFSSTQCNFAASSPRRPQVARIVHRIRIAIRCNHLGLALTLLNDNPLIKLPEEVADELAGRLRMRRVQGAAQQGVDDVVSLLGTVTRDDWLQEEGTEREVQLLLKLGKIDEAIAAVEAAGRAVQSNVVHKLVQTVGGMGQIGKCVYLIEGFCRRVDVRVTANMIGELVDACGRVGNLDRGTAVLEGFAFGRLDVGEKRLVYERLVNACVKCKELEKAEGIVKRMRIEGVGRTEGVYEALLYGAARRGGVEKCLAIFEEMSDDGLVPGSIRVYNALIKGCSRAGRIKEATAFYERIAEDGLAPDLDTFNGLLSCCARAGEVDKAFALLTEMQEAAGIMPNPKSYNWVVVACAKVADADRAFQVTRKMRRQGIRLNIVTKNNLIEACCNAGRLERAFTIVRHMTQEERVTPNAHTYNTLIKGCGRWGQLDTALKLLSSMQMVGVSPTVITYSVAIDACARTGGPIALQQALHLVDEMGRVGLEPNVVTYNSLIHACARAKDVNQAFKVLERMQREKLTPDNVTLCSLVDACGRAGMIRKAFGVMRLLPKKFSSLGAPSLPAYNALLRGCCKANDIEGMNTVLSDMQRLKLLPNMVTFSTLLSAHAAVGDVKKVLSVLEEMKDAGFRPNRLIFTSIITAYGHRGKVSAAMDIFEQARETCGEPDEELYTSAIVAAIGGGRVEMAVKLSKEMNRAGYSVPTALTRWMRRVGDVERSGEELRNILTAMHALQIRPKRGAMESLLAAYVKEGNVEGWLALLPEMSRMGYTPNLQCYRKVVECFALNGSECDVEKALALFRAMRADSIDKGEILFQTDEWVELYAEVARAVRSDRRAKLLQGVADSCGFDVARGVAERVCPEHLGLIS